MASCSFKHENHVSGECLRPGGSTVRQKVFVSHFSWRRTRECQITGGYIALSSESFRLTWLCALVRGWGLSSIKVRTRISLRIIRVEPGTIFLITGGADSRRESPRGWSCAGGRVAVYVGSLPFERWHILCIPLGSVASEC